MAESTATQRTRSVKWALEDAGYTATVRSTPASHAAQRTTVHQAGDPEAVAAYLGGFYGEQATVAVHAGVVSIQWAVTTVPTSAERLEMARTGQYAPGVVPGDL